MELDGAVAFVTGASAGIGEVTAVMLARRGARVVLAARREDRLEKIAAAIEHHGGRASALRCDVGDSREVTRLAGLVRESHGGCDVLINNAGIPGGGRFADVSTEQIERTVRTNLLGVMLCTHAFLPMMRRRGRGHVVNVASLAGRHAVPGAAVYAATKHGVVAFSESLFHEVEPDGILVTAVDPGLTATEGFPQTGIDPRLVMSPQRVARAIVDVIVAGRAPEVSVPRWAGAGQIARVIAPRPYRWAVRTVSERIRPRAVGRD